MKTFNQWLNESVSPSAKMKMATILKNQNNLINLSLEDLMELAGEWGVQGIIDSNDYTHVENVLDDILEKLNNAQPVREPNSFIHNKKKPYIKQIISFLS